MPKGGIMAKHRYDLKPSDENPISNTSYFMKPLRASLPPLVDMTGVCPPIQDQGNLGSCTAHAMSGMLLFLELQDFRQKITMAPEEFAGKGLQYPSRLFIYYNERKINGQTDQDAGASISDSVRAVVNYGFCNETTWPYKQENLTLSPTEFDYSVALKHRCSKYRALSFYDLQACLANGNPFIIGIQVYESFESEQVALTGIVPMPNLSFEKLLGGHAICVVGYDDPNQQFICRNSWGTSWGLNGYFRLPYDYLASNYLSGDFWTVIK